MRIVCLWYLTLFFLLVHSVFPFPLPQVKVSKRPAEGQQYERSEQEQFVRAQRQARRQQQEAAAAAAAVKTDAAAEATVAAAAAAADA